MVKLAQGITEIIILEYGEKELLTRLSDPFWFQAFSCVLGYDWHSSGTTTVTCGAIKEALDPEIHGICVAGGKGKTSKKAPLEILDGSEIIGLSEWKIKNLVYASKMSAKVDNSAIQDSYRLYHHVLVFTEDGDWCVIQQGMNPQNSYARRYHWLSDSFENYVHEPHASIVGEKENQRTLDMTSCRSQKAQRVSLDLVRDSPKRLKNLVYSLRKPNQSSLSQWGFEAGGFESHSALVMPRSINWNAIFAAYEFQPKNYEKMLAISGIGPATVRALALISEVVYGEKASWNDPVKFSFAVGGKDGVPYPVDKKVMDESVDILRNGISQAKLGKKERLDAISRLRRFVPPDFDWW
jgi:hypothetical protein